MESQKSQSESQLPSSSTNPAITSCRKKKSEGASFIADLRDHIDEFVHASMDEHKTCFKKTIEKVSNFCTPISKLYRLKCTWYTVCSFNSHQWRGWFPACLLQCIYIISGLFQMFGMSKIVSERSAALDEVESSLPLRTVSKQNPEKDNRSCPSRI